MANQRFKDMMNQIQDMISTNRVDEPKQLSYPTFEAVDLTAEIDALLTDKAKTALKTQTFSTVHQYNEPVSSIALFQVTMGSFLDKLKVKYADEVANTSPYIRKATTVKYFGITVNAADIDKGIAEITNFINDLASKGFIKASLSTPMSIQLADEKIAIVTYLAIDDADMTWVQSNYSKLIFQEGGVPMEL